MNDKEFSSLILPITVEDLQLERRILTFSSECVELKDAAKNFVSDSFWKEKFPRSYNFEISTKVIVALYTDEWLTHNDMKKI